MSIAAQVLVSLLLVAVVIFVMWRLPRRGEKYFAWAPPLALGAAWGGLLSLVTSIAVFFVHAPDAWVVAMFLILDPGALASGVLVMWVYRGHDDKGETVLLQRLQARVGIGLTLIAVALGYAYVMTHKAVFTPVGTP